MNTEVSLIRARAAAGRYLADRGYVAEAKSVVEGQGDDFAEVRIALAMLSIEGKNACALEKALAVYADEVFWQGGDGSAAIADGGAVARQVLTKRQLCACARP